MVDIAQSDAGFAKTVVDGAKRKFVGGEGDGTLSVLDVPEAFLFSRRDDAPVPNQARGRIMIGGIDAEGVHYDSKGDARPATVSVRGALLSRTERDPLWRR